jgi:antitoxin CcdA
MPSVRNTAPNDFCQTGQPLNRTANLPLGADALDQAKALELNFSQMRDEHSQEMATQEQAYRWQKEYADFIAAYNATIRTEGLPLDQWRSAAALAL